MFCKSNDTPDNVCDAVQTASARLLVSYRR